MSSHREDPDIAVALRALRPTPSPQFAAGLDARVAAGFPRGGRGAAIRTGLAARLRATPPRRLLLPAGAFALAAVVVTTAVVAVSENGTEGPRDRNVISLEAPSSGAAEEAVGRARGNAAPANAAGSSGAAATAGGSEELSAPLGPPAGTGPYASRAGHRAVERSTQMVLGDDPSQVRSDSAQVFEAVHAADGIVLRSTIRDGSAGDAGAEFDLLIPSARVGDALAAFSGIAEVRSRRESTQDITAPTIGVGERLQDSRARLQSLLGELADAPTEAERAPVEAELRAERARAAALRSRLSGLRRRANLSHVSLRIETGQGDSTGEGAGWGVGDGFDDAGRILAVAAGVVVIGLAILAPFALIVLLAWLAHRAWLRRARRTALGRS